MGDLGLGFSDVFVAAILVYALVLWTRDKQRRMDREQERDIQRSTMRDV